VGGGGQRGGQVAQVVLDLPEGLAVGQVGQPLGHPAEGLLAVGAEALQEGLDARLAVVGGLRRGRSGGVPQGDHPGVVASKGFGFRPTPRS